MDQAIDDEKEGPFTPKSAVETASDNYENAHNESNTDGLAVDEEESFRGIKRRADMSLVAPKPKIKKKLNAVISELKTAKEVPNPFLVSIPEGSEFGSQNSTRHGSFQRSVSPVNTNFKESDTNLPSDASDKIESDNNLGKQYSISDNTDSNYFENIYKSRLAASSRASASPKVKCKSLYEHPTESFSSSNRCINPSLEDEEETCIGRSSRAKLSPEYESNDENNSTAVSGTEANLSLLQYDTQAEPSSNSARDDSGIASLGSLHKSEKLDSIPVAKVDPLIEPRTYSDDEVVKNESDSDSEKGAKEKSDVENDESDCDVNKDSLMGGSTGLSARPKVKNMRKNIRDIIADDKLEEDTLAAQKEEQLRLQRLQEKRVAMREYLEQQQVERLVAEVAEAAEAVTAAEAVQEVEEAEDSSQLEPIKEIKKESPEVDDDVVVLSSEESDSDSKDSESEEGFGLKFANRFRIADSCTETKPLPCLLKPKLEIKSEKDSESETEEESESDSDSDVVVLSASEDDRDIDEDVNNSGAHVNDDFNVCDVNGRVLVNVGHPEKEEDIFLPPQLAAAVKPHQIGGLRFLYDNIVESLEQFKTSNGFGCILAHSMGLGKTLQVICLTDIFIRHTMSTSVLIIVPINTLQNWLSEYNHWLPDEIPAGVAEETGFRPRNFKVFLMNDSQKNIKSRAKVIDDWHKQGGVLLMGYEIYRQLSLKKPKKPKRKKRKNSNELVDIEEEDSNKEYLDEIHKALVRPGPDLVICDEGHRIKNAHANISQALKSIRTRRRIVLTGYPLQNNLLEYWCMVDFVRPNYLGTKTEFTNMFERPIQNGQCVDSTPQDVKLMRYRAHVLHALLEGFVQRRGHSVLASTLPIKHEHVILCRLTPIQRKLYTAYMDELSCNKGMANPLKAFAICCKIWNHPDVLYNLVMKRLNQDLDLDLDEVVGKPGTKSKRAITPKVDKRKGVKQNLMMDAVVPTNAPLPVQKANNANSMNTQQNFQPNPMGPPQMMTQHQTVLPASNPQLQRMPMNNNSSEHSNVNMGYPYPNMYNMQPPQAPPYMNQMHYPWSYNQTFSPDSNSQYMPPYNMYPPQYPQTMHQNQQEVPQYSMPPPGHMGTMAPPNTVCSQSVHGQNITGDQINANEQSKNQNRQQNGGSMTEQQMDSMETNSHGGEQTPIVAVPPQIMPMPHMQNSATNAHMEQNLSNNMNLGDNIRTGVVAPLAMPDGCKFNYMPSQSPKISDQMNNLALNHKDFNSTSRNMNEDVKPQFQCSNLLPNLAPRHDMASFERIQENSEKGEVDEDRKEDFKKEKEEVSLEWAETYFKDYVPGLLETSTKFQIFFKILEGSVPIGDRVLVFSQSLFTLSHLEEFMQKTNIPGTEEKWAKNRTYYRLDGSTPAQERDKLITDYNINPLVRVFLVSTRAGSLGINLVGANRVVVFDASFNPCHDTQAVCRIYRYGQQKDCHVYRFVTDNSLERRIYDRQVNKQGISDRIVDEMNPDAHLSSKEISNLLVEKEEEPDDDDFSNDAESLSDPIFKEIIQDNSHLITRPPFRHESLLVDRKDKKLSNAEKRLAKRSYELEKQANISYSRPSYSSFYPKTTGVQAAMGTKIGGVLYSKPVGTVRPMQVDGRQRLRVEGGIVRRPNILSRSSNTPVESLAKQGVSVQQITVPKDVSIPTNSGDGKPIQLKGGQSVMVIKTQKGMYLRLSDGKIVAIRIPPGNEDAFGLPLSQGSVTIVPTVYPSRGRSVGPGRGNSGSTIRRGRPPLSAQYALGQVVPKGLSNSQMAVRIMRKQVASQRGGKASFHTVAVPVSGQGTLLNKSVVITPAKPGQKVTKDLNISPKVQITAIPSKGALASIGGTSGLNRRLNRNDKLLFQQATAVKMDDDKKHAAAGKMEDDKKQAILKPESPSDDSDSMSSNENSPIADSALFGANVKPNVLVDEERQNKIMSTIDAVIEQQQQPALVEPHLNTETPTLEIKGNISQNISTPVTSSNNNAISNVTPNPAPESILNPLSQLSNLLPPDERGTQAQLPGTFTSMPQQSAQAYSQPVYSNHQLFQPYLQQTITSSADTSHAAPQLPMTSTSDPVKPWSKLEDELQPNSVDPIQGMSNLKAPASFLPPLGRSHYQNSSHLDSQTTKLPSIPYRQGSQISQASGDDQHPMDGDKDSNNVIGQMLSQPTTSSIHNDNPLSLANLLPESASSDIPINPSAPLDYMNFSTGFRRLDYPTNEVPSMLHTPTSEIESTAPPPYTSPVATQSTAYPGPNPPYSQYPAYSNHSFRTPTMNPPGYPYVNQFPPYGHYAGLNPQGPPPQPPQQQYPGIPNQENYNYNGSIPPYAPGTGNFGQGPYPPM